MDVDGAAPIPPLDRRHHWHVEGDPWDRECVLAVCRVCGWRRWLSKPALRDLIHRLRVERPRLLLSIARRLGVSGVHGH